ncbi:hypothetical protein Tco_1273640 [Tanacetum coccineum]
MTSLKDFETHLGDAILAPQLRGGVTSMALAGTPRELRNEPIRVQNEVDVNEISRLKVRHSIPYLKKEIVYFLSHIGGMGKLENTLLCINKGSNSLGSLLSPASLSAVALP